MWKLHKGPGVVLGYFMFSLPFEEHLDARGAVPSILLMEHLFDTGMYVRPHNCYSKDRLECIKDISFTIICIVVCGTFGLSLIKEKPDR